MPGIDGINYSDGEFSIPSPVEVFGPGPIQKLYAVKHNPLVYFKNIQLGTVQGLSFQQIQDFDGPSGLWADLSRGTRRTSPLSYLTSAMTCTASSPAARLYALAAIPAPPRQRRAFSSNRVMRRSASFVNGIKASQAWQKGRNAIIVVWDENDYSNAANRVVMLVETSYATNGQKSATFYDHFSLLRTLEAGFGLPCLDHACDSTSLIMNDMFGGK